MATDRDASHASVGPSSRRQPRRLGRSDAGTDDRRRPPKHARRPVREQVPVSPPPASRRRRSPGGCGVPGRPRPRRAHCPALRGFDALSRHPRSTGIASGPTRRWSPRLSRKESTGSLPSRKAGSRLGSAIVRYRGSRSSSHDPKPAAFRLMSRGNHGLSSGSCHMGQGLLTVRRARRTIDLSRVPRGARYG